MDGAALCAIVLVLVIWLVLPLAAISVVIQALPLCVPFLPALALMGAMVPPRAGDWMGVLRPCAGSCVCTRGSKRSSPDALRPAPGRACRALLALAVTFAAAAGGVVFGRIEFMVGTIELASAGVLRPALWAFVFGVLLMPPRRFRHWLLVLLVGGLLPVQGYRDSLALLGAGAHPRRSLSSCIARTGRRRARAACA